MTLTLLLIVLLSLLVCGISWIPPTNRVVQFDSTKKLPKLLPLKVAQPTESTTTEGKAEVFLPQFFLSSKPDQRSITATLIGQGVLVGITFLTAYFFKQETGLENIRFDYESVRTALFIAAPMIVGGFIFDNLPWKVAKEINRDTKVFTVRMLGRESNILTSVLISFLLACTFLNLHSIIISISIIHR